MGNAQSPLLTESRQELRNINFVSDSITDDEMVIINGIDDDMDQAIVSNSHSSAIDMNSTNAHVHATTQASTTNFSNEGFLRNRNEIATTAAAANDANQSNNSSGNPISNLVLALALMSHNQAIKFQSMTNTNLFTNNSSSGSEASSTTTSASSRRRSSTDSRNQYFCYSQEHAQYWLACGLSSSGRGQYAQYSFPILPDVLKNIDPSVLMKTLNNKPSSASAGSVPFGEYKGQVEALQYCLPENAECVEILEQIERDLPRTFPERLEFRDERMRNSLRRVLIAIAAAFPHVEYVQGQNFLAAFLLIHAKQDEDVAFCLLRMLMEHPKYKMHEMMMHGMPKLVRLAGLLELLVRRHYPRVQEHFDAIGLDTMLYSQNWIQTIFSYAMDFETLTFVWDIYFEDGWVGFLRVCLVLIGEIQSQLIKSDFETCVSLLRKAGSTPSLHVPELARSYKLSVDDEATIAETIYVDEPRRNL